MMRFTILIFTCLIFAGCSSAKTASMQISNTESQKPAEIAQTKPETKLSPVQLKVNLPKKQRKDFDEALPPNVREFLEKAEKIEILADAKIENSKLIVSNGEKDFIPKIKFVVSGTNQKKEILESFYFDVAHKGSTAACWLPHHKLIATTGDKTVEIEICYMCARFSGSGSLGEFDGSFHREVPETKSEVVINRLLEKSGIEIK